MNFKNATASVIGSSHYKLYYNNQDSYSFYQDRTCILGVVADGCGSGSNSEVGAKLGVDFVVNFCKKNFSRNPFDKNLLENALIEY
ncbi:protein phosphatase 2C domain-containing protein [Rhodoflexus caldus]|uniref:protein phosphatase 2C domain-containing protein n=1 Tax=Rhodoflexus caldus TaxID=2891236 RepID=UPI002029E9E2|nr:protein phosphatase 2C domain-containing protein [Rhodoflexus caldus]